MVLPQHLRACQQPQQQQQEEDQSPQQQEVMQLRLPRTE